MHILYMLDVKIFLFVTVKKIWRVHRRVEMKTEVKCLKRTGGRRKVQR